MREIVFDTETTGLKARGGDRLVEIGCVEMVNRFLTGETFHAYINPQREMDLGAFEVHGLSTEFLSDKPVFKSVVDDFLTFIGTDDLVAHNASFDMSFINMELEKVGKKPIQNDSVVDTLALARRKHPAGPNSLDALCARYNIDKSGRTLHGALIDAQLLADVYIELLGGRQADLGLAQQGSAEHDAEMLNWTPPPRPTPLKSRLSEADRKAHRDFVKTLGDDPLWGRYIDLSQKD